MEFEVLAAWSAGITVRSFADGRDWSYGIVYRDGLRRMDDWVRVRSSMDDALPSVAEAIPPFAFARETALQRHLIDETVAA